MLLESTIKTLKSLPIEPIKETLQDALISHQGVSASVLDIIFGHYFNYVMLENGLLAPVFLYENRLTYKQSQVMGHPKLHFCNCAEIKQDFSADNRLHTLANRHYTARITRANKFSFSIHQGLKEVGLYNDYPLELCAMCADMVCDIKGFNKREDEKALYTHITQYLFKSAFLEVFADNASLREKELIAITSANISCYKCQMPLSVDSNAWIQISNNMIKIYCC